jgi:hypothetical protein
MVKWLVIMKKKYVTKRETLLLEPSIRASGNSSGEYPTRILTNKEIIALLTMSCKERSWLRELLEEPL